MWENLQCRELRHSGKKDYFACLSEDIRDNRGTLLNRVPPCAWWSARVWPAGQRWFFPSAWQLWPCSCSSGFHQSRFHGHGRADPAEDHRGDNGVGDTWSVGSWGSRVRSVSKWEGKWDITSPTSKGRVWKRLSHVSLRYTTVTRCNMGNSS